jgi:endonuclease/exonuclease/phosphatase family metal-dependent hydrolase
VARLASFNVLHGRSLADGSASAAGLASACASLDADVLGLQEVDRGQERSGLADQPAAVAGAVGAVDWRFVPTLVGSPGGIWRPASAEEQSASDEAAYGIAMFSRLPVQWWRVLRLPPPSTRMRAPVLVPGTSRWKWISDEPRVAICARLSIGECDVTVATTHLSFIPAWNAWQLRRLVRALRGLPGPYLLMGDLNLPGRLPPLLAGWTPLVRGRTFPAHAPRLQLDHVLASPWSGWSATGERVVELPVSDHRAVVVDVEPSS